MQRIVLLLLWLVSIVPVSAHDVDTDSIITELDRSLANRKQYEQAKQGRLKTIYQKFPTIKDNEQLFKNYIKLYDEYKSYKYDSANVYAQKSIVLARQMKNPDFLVEAYCAKVFCLLSAGLFKEAFEEIENVSLAGVSDKYKKIYYTTQVRLNYDNADYNHSQPYQEEDIRRGNLFTDTLLTYLKPGTQDWLYAVGMRQMKNRKYKESIDSFEKLLKLKDIDAHTKAIVTSSMGWINRLLDNDELAIYYLAQAAIIDNISATRETTALRGLGSNLYEKGDVKRAIQYVRLSLDDANFYDARQRKIEIGNILPIIEKDRFDIVQSQRNTMAIAVGIAVLLILALLIGGFIIRKQLKRLTIAQKTIEARNNSLQESNEKLQEANEIKEEYIGKSFYLNSEYISMVEKLYKTIDRKITTRQFDDLKSSVQESRINMERKNMFSDFDETFLKLFPQFVEEYNKLFEPEMRKEPETENALTTEMRIFALIRLGISDSERIANFLNYSVHTINTYKTRVKNKSRIDNDLFEQHIMKI
ncbi:MAG: DUF6377 domain-containing protein [Prevotella sp.]|jgi:hypothetical protein